MVPVPFPHLTWRAYFPCLRKPPGAVCRDYITFRTCRDSLCPPVLLETKVSGWSLRPIPAKRHGLTSSPSGGQCGGGAAETGTWTWLAWCSPFPPPHTRTSVSSREPRGLFRAGRDVTEHPFPSFCFPGEDTQALSKAKCVIITLW